MRTLTNTCRSIATVEDEAEVKGEPVSDGQEEADAWSWSLES